MISASHYLKSKRRLLKQILLMALFSQLCLSAEAAVSRKLHAEAWIKERVQAGELADLEVEFKDQEDRKISAAFLEALLTNSIEGLKIHHRGVQIKSAIVPESVNLSRAEIPFDVSLEYCVFEKDVNFSLAHFRKSLFLEGTNFIGIVNLNHSDVGTILMADSTHFNASNFANIKTGGTASFERATFNGRADFGYSDIGGSFSVVDAKFLEPGVTERDITTFFDSMRVNGHGFFRRAVFKGATDFRRSHFSGNFEVNNAKFERPPTFIGVHVGDTAFFTDSDINGLAQFGDMTYMAIDVGSKEKVLELFDHHSVYNPDVYTNLEQVFLRHGDIDAADDFYVAGRQRARKAYWAEKDILKFGWNYVQDKVAGYGRRLTRALLISVLFVLLGWIIFMHEDNMMTQKEEDALRYKGRYRPGWYSLSLFLPIITLEDSKIWMPRLERKKSRIYMRVHMILGYLLIPIGIAAWTGIIK
jgi:hypothetical protein